MPISIRPSNTSSVATHHLSASREFIASRNEFRTSWNRCIIDDSSVTSVVTRVFMACPDLSCGQREYQGVGAVLTFGKVICDPPGGARGKIGG